MKKLAIVFIVSFSIIAWGCGRHSTTDKNRQGMEAVSGHDHSEGETHDHDHSAGVTHDHATGDDHNHPADEPHDHDHSAASEPPGNSVAVETHDHSGEIEFTGAQAEAAGLKTEIVRAEGFSQVIKTSGAIQTAVGDEITVVAPTSGVVYLANSSITEGTAVAKGSIVASVSSSAIGEGDNVVKARVAYETAKREFERAESLIGDRIISQRDYEQARLSYETARVTYEALSPNATATGVRVNSPLDGYVKNILVPHGSYVEVGQPIMTVSQNRRLQLRADVSQRYYGDLVSVTGANFRLSYDDRLYRLADLNGRVVSYGKSSSDNSNYIPVTFEFDNVGSILPGAFAEIYLLSAPAGGVIAVPHTALIEEQGLFSVYVKVHDEDYVKRSVTCGRDDGQNVEITSGLRAGEEVVVQGAYQLKLASSSTAIPHSHSH